MTYQMTVNVHTYRVNSIIKLEQILYAIRVLLLLIVKRVKKKIGLSTDAESAQSQLRFKTLQRCRVHTIRTVIKQKVLQSRRVVATTTLGGTLF